MTDGLAEIVIASLSPSRLSFQRCYGAAKSFKVCLLMSHYVGDWTGTNHITSEVSRAVDVLSVTRRIYSLNEEGKPERGTTATIFFSDISIVSISVSLRNGNL